MPSVLNVDTLTDAAGTGPVALTKQSAAKAWFQFAGRGTAALNDGLNITSLSDVGTGNYDLSYTNNMANTTYAFSNGQGWDVGVTSSTTSGTDKDLISTSGIRVVHVNMADGAYDPDLSMGSFDGDLA